MTAPAFKTVTVTIATTTQLSPAIKSDGYRIAAIYVPAATEGAAITFTASPTKGGTYLAVNDAANNPISWTRVGGTATCIINQPGSAEYVPALPYFKIDLGAAQTGADADITILLERV